MDRPAIPLIGPKFFKDTVKVVLDYIDANRPVSGIGVDVADVAGGRAINAKSSTARASSSSPSHPFKVLQRNNGTAEAPVWQWKVILESSLYKSLRPNDKQAITGLDTWFDAIANDAIWLGVVFDSDGDVTSASIDSWGQGDDFNLTVEAWSGNNGYCEDDGGSPPYHQASRILIAYSTADDEGNPVLVQKLNSDLVLFDANEDGRACKLFEKYDGGYPL